MDEEERNRQWRKVSRDLISDSEFNLILDDMAHKYFQYAIANNPVETQTKLLCYDSLRDEGGHRKVTELSLALESSLDEEYMNRLGKKIFGLGLTPVATFIIGFGDFHFGYGNGTERDGKAILIAGLTLDNRSGHAQVELAMGDTRLIPIKKYVFPYAETDNYSRFNHLTWVFDGYAKLMKEAEVQDQLQRGFTMIGYGLKGKG